MSSEGSLDELTLDEATTKQDTWQRSARENSAVSWVPLGGGQAVSARPFDLKREVDIVKPRNAQFGVELQVFRRDTYVVGIAQYSVAWNVGLHIMDKLEAIDTVPVPRNADPADILAMLDRPKKFVLKVVDNTAIATNHVLRFQPDKALGLVYMCGEVTEVMDNSIASLADIRRGMAIISIQGRFVFGQNDANVLYMLKRTLEADTKVEVTCMDSGDAANLIGAIQAPAARPAFASPQFLHPASQATPQIQFPSGQNSAAIHSTHQHAGLVMELDIADSLLESDVSLTISPLPSARPFNGSESSLDLADAPIMQSPAVFRPNSHSTAASLDD